MTPGRAAGWDSNVAVESRHNPVGGQGQYPTNDDRYAGSSRDKKHEDGRPSKSRQVPHPRREKSLSPFSKRLALTQAMNMGK